MSKLLQVNDLTTEFTGDFGKKISVDHVSFDVAEGETVCIVGESGCGKSVTSLSIMGLLGRGGAVVDGSVLFANKNLLDMDEKQLDTIRGNQMTMIFQDPLTSLNPVFTIGSQITESIRIHMHLPKKEAGERAVTILEKVGMPDARAAMKKYPHMLSGGMRQRVMIAMALCCNPKLLIADEPTTALDVTIQAQILDLLRNLKDQINSSIMFITHDLGVIAEMADYVVVMYAGRIVEQGTAEEIFSHPAHPYTIGLMASKPVVGRQVEKLYSIPGKVPNPVNMPNYCYFKDRCEMALPCCDGEYPCEISLSPTHKVSCYRYYDGKRPDLEEVVEEELAEGKENGKEGE